MPKGNGARYPRSSQPPVKVMEIAEDETIPWKKTILGEGRKGPVVAEMKCMRVWESCLSPSRKKETAYPGETIWLLVRKYEDGNIKYFICNAPEDTSVEVLNGLTLKRWSIEQCFEECKSYLGMGHYETRSYTGWERHVQLVMIAHLATHYIREVLKKANLTMPMIKRLLRHVIKAKSDFEKELKITLSYLRRNAIAYQSHRKTAFKSYTL